MIEFQEFSVQRSSMNLDAENTPESPVVPDPDKAVSLTSANSPAKWKEVLAEGLEEELHSFASLRGTTAEELFSTDVPDTERGAEIELLRQVITLGKQTMIEMNRRSFGLPVDSVDSLLDMLTKESAQVVMLKAAVPVDADNNLQEQLVGYGLVMTEPDDFPDIAEIPKEVLTDKQGKPIDVCRVIRMFVSDEGRAYFPDGEAASRIVKGWERIAAGRRMVGKVLVGPEDLDPVWFQALKALEARGFEDTGFAAIEDIDQHTTRQFRWYVNPPITDKGHATVAAYNERNTELKRRIQERLAWMTAHTPLNDAKVLVVSAERDSYRAAGLLRGNYVIGVEHDPYNRKSPAVKKSPNLTVVDPNAEWSYAEADSVDTAFISSVLPEVDDLNVMLDGVGHVLKERGILILRSPLAPENNRVIQIDLAVDDGDKKKPSTAELFERFRKYHLESSTSDDPVDRIIEEVESGEPQRFRSYRLSLKAATEFLIKKDYHRDFEVELTREHTRFDRDDIEQALNHRGYRVLQSQEERSEWIYQKRWEGAVQLSELNGEPLEWPATNHVIAAQKIPEGESVRIAEESREFLPEPHFLKRKDYGVFDLATGELMYKMQLVRRPDPAIDLGLYSEHAGQLFMHGKVGYPRGMLNHEPESLDGSRLAGYVAEPVSAISPAALLRNPELRELEIQRVLQERAGVDSSEVEQVGKSFRYLTSPGGVDEVVEGQLIKIEHPEEKHYPSKNYSNLSTSGEIDGIELSQLLRACQVGAMPEGRMERAAYMLALQERYPVGPWINSNPQLAVQPLGDTEIEDAVDLLQKRYTTKVDEIDPPEKNFLEVARSEFVERDSSGEKIASVQLEYATPSRESGLSNNTVLLLPVKKVQAADGNEEILVGVELRDELPGAYLRGFGSVLAVAPAFRVSDSSTDLETAKDASLKKLNRQFGIEAGNVWNLGSKYVPTIGTVPEVVYPMLVEIGGESEAAESLHFVRLQELLDNVDQIGDGHLLTAVFRASHALGLLEQREYI